MMALSTLRLPFEGLGPINEVKDALIHIKFNSVHHYHECS